MSALVFVRDGRNLDFAAIVPQAEAVIAARRPEARREAPRGSAAGTVFLREDRNPPGSVPGYMAALRADPCAYCGEAGGVLDHIEPKLNGAMRNHGRPKGRNTWSNLTGACNGCNSSKGAKTLLGYLGYRDWMLAHGPLLTELRVWTQVGT